MCVNTSTALHQSDSFITERVLFIYFRKYFSLHADLNGEIAKFEEASKTVILLKRFLSQTTPQAGCEDYLQL